MPEGDTLHRAARRLQALVGERLEVESPHPRAQAERVAEQIDGRRLDSVEAIGKHLVLPLETAGTLMGASVAAGREPRKQVHSRAGRACPRCATPIRSRGQGDANRTVYWCPVCQPGPAAGP